mgnify:CR=1 FL=1
MLMKNNSKIINNCQIGCKTKLKKLFFFGYIPAVNDLKTINKEIPQIESFPLELFFCETCKLGQINCIVDREILFPIFGFFVISLTSLSNMHKLVYYIST